jgi:RimJ/RimL family protein N-acetyltransferase
MRYFKKIVGDRVYLSPVNPDDAERYTGWVNDLETAVNLTIAPQIISLDKEREVLEEMAKGGYNFAIVRREDDALLGNCGLLTVDQVQRTAELGIFIGEKVERGKGYGSEALELLLDYAFNLLNLHSIYLRVRSFNEAAIKSYEKVGFEVIGRRRECVRIGGSYYDEIYMDILEQDFEGKIPSLLR